MEKEIYPGVAARVKALIIDQVVMIILMVLVTMLFSKFEGIPDYLRIIAFLCIFFIYDPILTAFCARTLGHRFIGLQVKQEKNQDKNIPIYFAIVRFVFKIFFGWISLLTVMKSEKSRAIHDMVVKSVVIYKN